MSIASNFKLAVARIAVGVAMLATPSVSIFGQISQVIHNARASWYGREHHGKMMANGQRFDETKLTAAHKAIPFGTKLLLRSKSGKTVVVEVTDRGPWVKGRDLDISLAAARALGIASEGISMISYQTVAEE